MGDVAESTELPSGASDSADATSVNLGFTNSEGIQDENVKNDATADAPNDSQVDTEVATEAGASGHRTSVGLATLTVDAVDESSASNALHLQANDQSSDECGNEIPSTPTATGPHPLSGVTSEAERLNFIPAAAVVDGEVDKTAIRKLSSRGSGKIMASPPESAKSAGSGSRQRSSPRFGEKVMKTLSQTLSGSVQKSTSPPPEPPTSTSAGGKVAMGGFKDGSLLRMFQSEFFDAYFHLYYLFHHKMVGVHEYLVNLLYRRTDADLETYLPQLCQISLVRYQTSSLKRFLLDKGSQSMFFSVKLTWLYQSAAEDKIPGLEEAALRMTQETEIAVVNSKPFNAVGMEKIKPDAVMPNILRRCLRTRRCKGKRWHPPPFFFCRPQTSAKTTDRPRANSQNELHSSSTPQGTDTTIREATPIQNSEAMTSAGGGKVFTASMGNVTVDGAKVKLPSVYRKLGWPFTRTSFPKNVELLDAELQQFISKQRRCDFYNHITGFVTLLIDVSNLLSQEPASATNHRKSLLIAWLNVLNEWMFGRRCTVAANELNFFMAGLVIPMSNICTPTAETGEANYSLQIIRAVPDMCKVFATKKRCPYLVVFEVANFDEDIDMIEAAEQANAATGTDNPQMSEAKWSQIYTYEAILKEVVDSGLFAWPTNFSESSITPQGDLLPGLKWPIDDNPLRGICRSLGLDTGDSPSESECPPDSSPMFACAPLKNDPVTTKIWDSFPLRAKTLPTVKGETNDESDDEAQDSRLRLARRTSAMIRRNADGPNEDHIDVPLHSAPGSPKKVDEDDVESPTDAGLPGHRISWVSEKGGSGQWRPPIRSNMSSPNLLCVDPEGSYETLGLSPPKQPVTATPPFDENFALLRKMTAADARSPDPSPKPPTGGPCTRQTPPVQAPTTVSGPAVMAAKSVPKAPPPIGSSPTTPSAKQSVRSLKKTVVLRQQLQNMSAKEVRRRLWGELWSEATARCRLASPYSRLRSWQLAGVIVKGGDDLRQELLASQLIKQFKIIFNEAKLPLWLRAYEILVTGCNSGIVEFVPDTMSVDSLKKSIVGVESISEVYDIAFKDNPFQAKKNFIESHAAYSIIGYLLQVRDRHNGNILIDAEGHAVHIDYGYFFTNTPGNVNFETSPFKLTLEYLDVMGGEHSDNFQYFRTLVITGFLEARKHFDRIMILIEVMLTASKMPCFVAGSDAVLTGIKERFMLNISEDACIQRIVELLDSAVNNWRSVQYDNFQRITNGIV